MCPSKLTLVFSKRVPNICKNCRCPVFQKGVETLTGGQIADDEGGPRKVRTLVALLLEVGGGPRGERHAAGRLSAGTVFPYAILGPPCGVDRSVPRRRYSLAEKRSGAEGRETKLATKVSVITGVGWQDR
jgi:hypothetical protein